MSTLIKEYSDKFWKYASICGKTDTIENIFIDWAQSEGLLIDDCIGIFNKVNADIKYLFSKKKEGIQLSTEEFRELMKNNSDSAPLENITPTQTPLPDTSAMPAENTVMPETSADDVISDSANALKPEVEDSNLSTMAQPSVQQGKKFNLLNKILNQ